MNKPTIYQELPPAVIEYKGIPYAIIDGPKPQHTTPISGKSKKKRKKNTRGIFGRVEIMTVLLFIGLFSCLIIYSALFKK
jgi:Na+/H+ antiporter NhaD/arsenite permease-like protein